MLKYQQYHIYLRNKLSGTLIKLELKLELKV